MIRLAFEEVGLRFGPKEIFRALCAEILSGRVTAVTGRNGSGKSTLLRLAAKLMMPDEGKVVAREESRLLEKGDYRGRLGMVTPEMRLYGRLTAEENLRFLAGMRGRALSKGEVGALWRRVGLSPAELRDVFAERLSTGMRQRVKMAVLLASGADVWILDEPCANLDEDGTGMFMEEARQAASSGKLVLWATNESGEEAVADEIIRL